MLIEDNNYNRKYGIEWEYHFSEKKPQTQKVKNYVKKPKIVRAFPNRS